MSDDRNDKDYHLVVDYVSWYKHVICCKYVVSVLGKIHTYQIILITLLLEVCTIKILIIFS